MSEQIPLEYRKWLDDLYVREGGFSDHPLDAGGRTMFGITQAAWSDYSTEPRDVGEITQAQADEFYWRKWIKHPRLRLHLVHPLLVPECVFDTAVLFGRRRAAIWLQEAANDALRHRMPAFQPLIVDGYIGPDTRRAVSMAEKYLIIKRIVTARVLRHAERVRDNPDQARFILGWTRRATDWLTVA